MNITIKILNQLKYMYTDLNQFLGRCFARVPDVFSHLPVPIYRNFYLTPGFKLSLFFSLFVIFGDLAFGILKLHITSSRHSASALRRCLFLRLDFTFTYRLHSIDTNNAADILRLPGRPRP